MSRVRKLSIAGVLVLAACSGGGSDAPSAATVVEPPSTAVAPVEDDDSSAAPQDGADATLAPAAEQWTVTVELVTDGFDGAAIDSEASWTGDPGASVEGGPFGDIGSCSGLREHVGAYAVLVSGADGIDAVNVWTADRVRGPGVYDAEVRVERPGSAPIAATGTMTIMDGLQRGEFLAFGPGGGRVEGSFSCVGAVSPSPLATAGSDDGAVDSVEVFALMRDGDAERVLGLAATASSGAECSAIDGRAGSPVVRVDGDATLGAITTFELSVEPAATALLRAAGVSYEFDDVIVTLDADGGSGVFSGTTEAGISVDGAFRCI